MINGNNKAIGGGAWHCFLWCRPLAVGPILALHCCNISHIALAVIRRRHLGALCAITLVEGANRAVAGKRPYWVRRELLLAARTGNTKKFEPIATFGCQGISRLYLRFLLESPLLFQEWRWMPMQEPTWQAAADKTCWTWNHQTSECNSTSFCSSYSRK